MRATEDGVKCPRPARVGDAWSVREDSVVGLLSWPALGHAATDGALRSAVGLSSYDDGHFLSGWSNPAHTLFVGAAPATPTAERVVARATEMAASCEACRRGADVSSPAAHQRVAPRGGG